MKMRALVTGAVFSLALISIVTAQGTPPTPEQQAEKAVKTRQGLFDVQAFAFGPVGAMLKGAPVDAATALKAAARLEVTGGMISEVFALDTTKFSVPTKAKPAVWSNKTDFDKKASEFLTAATALKAAAQKGDRASILESAGKVGDACKGCHESYRDK